MKLKTKIILAFVIVFACLTFIGYVAGGMYARSVLTDYEESEAVKNFERVKEALENERYRLVHMGREWKRWNEINLFISGINEELLYSETIMSTLSDRNIDLIMYFDPDQELAWSLAHDLAANAPISVNDLFDDEFESIQLLLDRSSQNQEMSGFVETKSMPIIVASIQVPNSEEVLKPSGTLILGQFVNEKLEQTLSALTKVEVSLATWDSSVEHTIQSRDSIQAEKKIQYSISHKLPDFISVSEIYEGISGRPLFKLSAIHSIGVYSLGRKVAQMTLFIVLGFWIILLLILFLTLHRLVLKPVRRLTDFAIDIQDTNDLSKRAEVHSEDELGQLSEQFNQMLDSVNSTKDQLEQHVGKSTSELNKLISDLSYPIDFLNSIFTQVQAGIAIVAVDKQIVFCNPAFANILDADQEKLNGKNIFAFIHPDSNEVVRDLATSARNGESTANEVKIISETKREKYVQVSVSPHMNDDGSFGGAFASIFDITERKENEEAVKKQAEEVIYEHEQRNKHLVELLPQTVLESDADGFITFANKAGYETFGYSREDYEKGIQMIQLFVPEVRERVKEKVQERTGDHESSHTELLACTKEGERFPVLLYQSPIINRGEFVGFRCIVVDISEIKRAEEELLMAKEAAEVANQLKSEFVSNMSHEIRTPLNSIIGFAETISNSNSLKMAHKQSKIILQESDILLALINDILDQSKIEAGKLELEYLPIDLYQLMGRFERLVASQARDKGLTFDMRIAENIPRYVHTDQVRIRQILMNLTSNAIKFTEKGSVKVQLESKHKSEGYSVVQFAVEDTGIGIPEERQESIFELFIQADGSTTRKYGGSGLGTTISKSLVELMGGKIGIRSAVGKGSTFWFELPLKECSADEVSDRAVSDGERQTDGFDFSEFADKKILIAEDYPPNQELAKFHLESVGLSVVFAENGKIAVEECQKQKYDLIFMDVQMPEMDGHEATGKIRSLDDHYAGVPIVGLTAHAQLSAIDACFDSGMVDVVNKPFKRKTLLAALEHWLVQTAESGEDNAGNTLTVPVKTHKSKTDAPMDWEVAVDEFGSEDLVLQLAEHFLRTVDSQLSEMEQALAKSDFESLHKEAHSIAGGTGSLEARDVEKAARELMNSSGVGKKEIITKDLEILKQEITRLKNYLHKKTMQHVG